MIAAMADAPVILDYLNDSSRSDFESVCSGLQALNIDYTINPRLVRGLDYYTKTTFEFVHPLLGAQSGIGGGGRYDGLMESLGGQPLSGIGFGIGIDRVLLACEAENLSLSPAIPLICYVIPLGESAATQGMQLVSELRGRGIRSELAFGERGLKGAMKAADKSGARFVLVLGDRELERGEGEIKELATGKVQSIRLSDLSQFLNGTGQES